MSNPKEIAGSAVTCPRCGNIFDNSSILFPTGNVVRIECTGCHKKFLARDNADGTFTTTDKGWAIRIPDFFVIFHYGVLLNHGFANSKDCRDFIQSKPDPLAYNSKRIFIYPAMPDGCFVCHESHLEIFAEPQ